MTNTTMRSLSTTGLRVDGYADALLGLIEVPEGGTVSTIILAHDGTEMMRAHFNPLTGDQFLSEREWWGNADVHANVYLGRFNDITEAAKRRWPGVRVFVVPGCLCCNGVESLLEYDCER